ncbi:unnamed protein product [Brassica rapa subsp. narinosa]
MPLQPCDSDVLLGQSSRFPSVQYFPRSTLPNRPCGLFRILQLSLPRKASLKLSKSRNPNPPFAFGCAILSHEIQAIFLFPVLSSHINLVTAD